MANQGSIANLKNNSIDQKVTTNGNGQNTGVRVNGCLQDIVDTLTASPVVSDGTPNPLSVFASAAQGLTADSAVQPGDLSPVATSGNYNDLTTYVATDGVTIVGDGTVGSPLTATFAFGFQGAYDPTVTSQYPTTANTISGNPITAGMYWVVDAVGTVNGNAVNIGDGIFALVNNAVDNDDNDWTIFPALYGGLPVLSVTGLDTDNTNPQNPVIQIAVDGATITGQGTAISPLVVSSAPVPTGNIAYVDAVNGNDGTGAVGDLSKPFLTLSSAQAAASLGDTVMVFPGTYSSGQLGENGVNWYFLPGATVNFSATGWRIASSLSSQSYSVYGFGRFNAVGSVVSFATSGNFYVEGDAITGAAINGSNSANITISANGIVATGGVSFSGGTSVINCPSINVGTGMTLSSTSALTVNGNITGPVTVASTSMRINGSITGSVAAPLLTVNGGSNVVTGNVTNNGAGRAISQVFGSLTLLGSQISRTTAGEVIFKSNGTMRLRDCWVVAEASSANSITGATSILCFNSHTNKPVTGVTIVGDLKLDSTSAATAGQVATILADGTWSWAAAGASGAALAGNVIIVDAVNGNDGTGASGDLTKPFLTLLAAQTAASAGQTILVYPGSYTSTALGKDGVNWYFMPGANVAFSSGNGFVASTAMTFKVRGYGNFNCTLGSARFVWTDNAGANIDIECDLITANVIRFSNGTARIKANSINILLNILAFGGTSTVIGDIFSSTASQLVDHTGGTIVIRDSNMTNTTPAAPCIKIGFGSGVSLENVTLRSAGSAVTTPATASIDCRGCFTVQGLGAGVTAVGDIQYDYVTQGTVGQVATVNADGTWSWA